MYPAEFRGEPLSERGLVFVGERASRGHWPSLAVLPGNNYSEGLMASAGGMSGRQGVHYPGRWYTRQSGLLYWLGLSRRAFERLSYKNEIFTLRRHRFGYSEICGSHKLASNGECRSWSGELGSWITLCRLVRLVENVVMVYVYLRYSSRTPLYFERVILISSIRRSLNRIKSDVGINIAVRARRRQGGGAQPRRVSERSFGVLVVSKYMCMTAP